MVEEQGAQQWLRVVCQTCDQPGEHKVHCRELGQHVHQSLKEDLKERPSFVLVKLQLCKLPRSNRRHTRRPAEAARPRQGPTPITMVTIHRGMQSALILHPTRLGQSCRPRAEHATIIVVTIKVTSPLANPFSLLPGVPRPTSAHVVPARPASAPGGTGLDGSLGLLQGSKVGHLQGDVLKHQPLHLISAVGL